MLNRKTCVRVFAKPVVLSHNRYRSAPNWARKSGDHHGYNSRSINYHRSQLARTFFNTLFVCYVFFCYLVNFQIEPRFRVQIEKGATTALGKELVLRRSRREQKGNGYCLEYGYRLGTIEMLLVPRRSLPKTSRVSATLSSQNFHCKTTSHAHADRTGQP